MKPQSFPRQNRIQKKNDFLVLRKSGKKAVARHWVVYYVPNNLGMPRLAITTTARFGNAIVRNRFRRRMREVFRKLKHILPAYDFHFVAKRNVKNNKSTNILAEMWADFEKLPSFLN